MFNLISDFFKLKRIQRKEYDLELAYLDADIELAKIENKLIESEPPEVRPYLAHEFDMQRAYSRMGFPTKSTEECIEMARLCARKF